MANQFIQNFAEKFRAFRAKRRAKNWEEKREVEALKMDPSHKKILITVCVIFAIYGFTLVFPLLWMLVNSVKDKYEFMANPWRMDGKVLFSNYTAVLTIKEFNFFTMFLNSMSIILTQPIINLFCTVCAAYAVSEYNFKLKKPIHTVAIAVMFIPTAGSMPVCYKLMYDSGLIDTMPGLIVMATGGFGFNYLMLHGMFKGISWNYAEAAQMDGAGHWRVFLQIMLPHIYPTLTAMLLLAMIGTWNDYTGPLMYYRSHTTVAVGLNQLSNMISQPGPFQHDDPKLFAAMIIGTIPVFIMFIACQKYITRLNLGGGLKG